MPIHLIHIAPKTNKPTSQVHTVYHTGFDPVQKTFPIVHLITSASSTPQLLPFSHQCIVSRRLSVHPNPFRDTDHDGPTFHCNKSYLWPVDLQAYGRGLMVSYISTGKGPNDSGSVPHFVHGSLARCHLLRKVKFLSAPLIGILRFNYFFSSHYLLWGCGCLAAGNPCAAHHSFNGFLPPSN
ncbi:MAG: hypothetical protein ACI8V2_002397 [Candidatus Latescibacterota bacterium]|jgi:hypothetical protein